LESLEQEHKLQLSFLQKITKCKDVIVWGRSENKLAAFKSEMEKENFIIETTLDINDVVENANLIITTTPSTEILLFADKIKSGTHIVAVGADSPHKQELDPQIFEKADIVVVDSISQAIERGDAAHAVRNGAIKKDKLIELGTLIKSPKLQRINDKQITVADLTGLAVQDIQMAKLIYMNRKDKLKD
jgi:ornithine cyclodeaminase